MRSFDSASSGPLERAALRGGPPAAREQWVLFADAYPATAASRVAARALDAAGRRLF